MKVVVIVSLKDGVLDPQGRVITQALGSLGYKNVSDLHVGKLISFDLDETDPEKAKSQAEEMARKLLANTVIEKFQVKLEGDV